jgi:aminoglycoside phosphotransferase (APT) family kinase protein
MAADDAFDPGPVPTRVPVTQEMARQLVAAQFPQWSGLPIEPVAEGGWDNWTFRLGTDMVVRLPSASEYALAVEKEHRWLPVLGPQLPLPIPMPLAKGEPDTQYPHVWSVYGWLDGVSATVDRIAEPGRFAVDLADFLGALQSIDAAEGPRPGVHNWFRGGPLRTYDDDTQRALEDVADHVDVDLAREIWADALAAPWDGVDRWFHGDVAGGNLLVRDGQLAAAVDFGTCGVGDPACDLAIAWTLLPDNVRQSFRDRLSVDEASWARGRGWALWKALVTCAQAVEDPQDAQESATAARVLAEIFSEYSGSHPAAPTGTTSPSA